MSGSTGSDVRRWAQTLTRMPDGSKVSGTHKVVLLVLALHCQTDDTCWPAVTRIMEQSCLSRRAVLNAISDLVRGGAIERITDEGRVNQYRLVTITTRAPDALVADHTGAPGARVDDKTSAPRARVSPATSAPRARGDGPDAPVQSEQTSAPRASPPTKPVHLVHQTRAPGAPESPMKYSKGNKATPSPQLALLAVLPGGRIPTFAEFYAAYPRKEARPRAEKAWSALIKAGVRPEEIMAGLAKHQFNPEPNRRPHPATWLNARQFEDEQAPNLYGKVGRSQPQYTPESYVEGVRRAAGVKVEADAGGDFLDASFLKQGMIG